jgi:hypothetical protein
MDATLFRRLVAGIPQTADTWSERARQDHDLEDFPPYSNEEIATTAAFLHGQEDATSSALPDNIDDEEEKEEVGWVDDVDIATSYPQLIPALMTFCIDGISTEIIETFGVTNAASCRSFFPSSHGISRSLSMWGSAPSTSQQFIEFGRRAG